MRTIMFSLLLGVAGCGGSSASFDVATYSLNVADQGYFISQSNEYCSTGAVGQMELDFVDFSYLCDPSHPQQRDTNAAHLEMKVILNLGTAPDFGGNYPGTPKSVPYPIEKGDCTNGVGTNQAHFYHYPAKATTPDTDLQADSGSIKITQFDINKVKPIEGQLDLHFGSKEIKETFKIYSCN